jgi:hypothetical protein
VGSTQSVRSILKDVPCAFASSVTVSTSIAAKLEALGGAISPASAEAVKPDRRTAAATISAAPRTQAFLPVTMIDSFRVRVRWSR